MQKPHAEYVMTADWYITLTRDIPSTVIIHIHKASTVCHILDEDLKFTRFQEVKNERRVNAFLCKFISRPLSPA